jgi:hypothetical protein
MPTFPTYDGELPSRLNLQNLRHYLLLAYWIYFRPSTREHPRMDAEYKYSDKYSREKAEEKVENRKSEPRSRE